MLFWIYVFQLENDFSFSGSIEVTWQIERERQFLIKNPFIIRAVKAVTRGGFSLPDSHLLPAKQRLNSESRKLAFQSGGFCVIRPINDTSLVLTQPCNSARDKFSCFKGNIVYDLSSFSAAASATRALHLMLEIMNRLVEFLSFACDSND